MGDEAVFSLCSSRSEAFPRTSLPRFGVTDKDFSVRDIHVLVSEGCAFNSTHHTLERSEEGNEDPSHNKATDRQGHGKGTLMLRLRQTLFPAVHIVVVSR